jgi:class 3 adenylate cyclase
MAGTSRIPPKHLAERKVVLMMVDLAGTSRAVAGFDAIELAELINTFFASCSSAITAREGRIVSFLGDGCLAVFDEGAGLQAVESALDLGGTMENLRSEFDVDVELGVNIHQAVVAEGEFEPDGAYNVMGTGVIHTFRMGSGAGIRISEPVYRQLPSDRRTPWRKHRPPATYTYAADEPR